MAALIVICGGLTIILIVMFTIGIKEKIDYYRARQRQKRLIRHINQFVEYPNKLLSMIVNLTSKNRSGKV